MREAKELVMQSELITKMLDKMLIFEHDERPDFKELKKAFVVLNEERKIKLEREKQQWLSMTASEEYQSDNSNFLDSSSPFRKQNAVDQDSIILRYPSDSEDSPTRVTHNSSSKGNSVHNKTQSVKVDKNRLHIDN